MENCSHGNNTPTEILKALHEEQAGVGRHKCTVCAYEAGKSAAAQNYTHSEGGPRCGHGKSAPENILRDLPENQGGTGRHKCVICAFDAGLRAGNNSIVELGQMLEEFKADFEGRRYLVAHWSYERSPKNRKRAIELHGADCSVCGFSFDRAYGKELSQDYVEIHHVHSITQQNDKAVNPETDLVPLCANCHRMAHRKSGEILSVSDLKKSYRQLSQVKKTTSQRLTKTLILIFLCSGPNGRGALLTSSHTTRCLVMF